MKKKLFLLAPLFLFTQGMAAAQDDPHAHHHHHQHMKKSGDAADNKHDPHAHHRMAMSKAPKSASQAKVNLPDVSVVSQHSEKMKFKTDVIGNNIVVINFAYTTCTTICPVTSSIFSMLQKKLSAEKNANVKLVTVTVDPSRDTPHKLLKYSSKFSSGKDWFWVTGEVKTIEKVLDAFGAYTPNFEDHPAMILVGDASTQEWYRYYGFTSPEKLSAKVKELLDKRKAAKG